MRAHRSTLLALASLLLLPACAAAQMPEFNAPSLAAMQHDSIDSVNISLGAGTLGFLRFLSRFGDEHDPHGAAAMNLLRGLHKVQIHSFKFATDHTYRQADLETLRSQLTAQGWQHLVQVRDRGKDGDVDIYCALKKRTITGLVIVAAEPREFTLVNIVGTIDPDQIGMLRQGFVPHDEGNRDPRSPDQMDASGAKSIDRHP